MPTYRKRIEPGDIVAVCPPDAIPYLLEVVRVACDHLTGWRKGDKVDTIARIRFSDFDIVPVLGSARCACGRRLPKVTHNKNYCAACAPLRKSERQREWNRKYREAGK